jgi:hypothetical protein
MKQLVDAVSTVCSDHATLLALCMLLDDVAILAEEGTWLDHLNSLGQAFSRGLGHANSVWICQCLLPNVVGLVQIAVESTVVERYVDVENVTVLEYSLIGDAVADDFVYRGTYRLGEVAVVEGGRVRLHKISIHCRY